MRALPKLSRCGVHWFVLIQLLTTDRVLWTSQQHSALLAVVGIATNLLADAPLWLRRMLVVRRVSGDAELVSPVHDHVPFVNSAEERKAASLVRDCHLAPAGSCATLYGQAAVHSERQDAFAHPGLWVASAHACAPE